MTDIKKYITPGINEQGIKNFYGRASATEKVLLERLVENFSKVDEDGDGFLSANEIKNLSKKGDGDESDISIRDIAALVNEVPKQKPPQVRITQVRENPQLKTKSKSPLFTDESTEVTSTQGGINLPDNVNLPALVEVLKGPKEALWIPIDTRINPGRAGQDPTAVKIYKPYLTPAEQDDPRIIFQVDRSDRFGSGRTSGELVAHSISKVTLERAGVMSYTKHEYEGKSFVSQHWIGFRHPGIFEVKGKFVVIPGEIKAFDYGANEYVNIAIERNSDGSTTETTTFSNGTKKVNVTKKDKQIPPQQSQTTQKQQTSITLLKEIQPLLKPTPLPIEINGDSLSEEFIRKVNTAMDSIPDGIEEFLKTKGFKLKLAKQITDVLPQLAGSYPNGHAPGTTYQNLNGVANGDTAVVSEYEVAPRTGKLRKGNLIEEVARHEIGHLFYYAIVAKNSENFDKLESAHKKDVEKMNFSLRSTFDYEIQPGHERAGLHEACAEVFAHLNGGAISSLNGSFPTAFPNLIKEMKEQIKEVAK